MAGNGKVMINLATGLEDAERVTVAFLVGGAAAEQGKPVTMFLTKEAVGLALPGYADAVACDGCLRSRASSSSTPSAAVSCSSARSASRPESSTDPSSSLTRGWEGRRLSGSGSATRPRASSATDVRLRAQGHPNDDPRGRRCRRPECVLRRRTHEQKVFAPRR